MELRLLKRPFRSVPFPVLFDEDEQIFELASRFLASLADSAKGFSEKTIGLYGKNLKYFGQYLRQVDRYDRLSLDQVVAALPPGALDQYFKHLEKDGIESATRRNRDVVLKKFFEWLTTSDADSARISSGYEAGLKTSAPKRKARRYVLPEQVIRLLGAFYHESQRCMVHAMYDTGVRVSEVPRILKEDVDALDHWPEDYAYLPLLIRGSKGRGNDNIKERYALMSRAVYSRIKRYHSTSEYRFARVKGPKPAFLNTSKAPITAKAIQRALEQARVRGGFNPRVISPHRLRHGTALTFLQGEFGRDYLERMVAIQTQFGHSSVRATEPYTDISPALFAQINGEPVVKVRFEQAQEIYEKTFLSKREHKERRGRKRK